MNYYPKLRENCHIWKMDKCSCRAMRNCLRSRWKTFLRRNTWNIKWIHNKLPKPHHTFSFLSTLSHENFSSFQHETLINLHSFSHAIFSKWIVLTAFSTYHYDMEAICIRNWETCCSLRSQWKSCSYSLAQVLKFQFSFAHSRLCRLLTFLKILMLALLRVWNFSILERKRKSFHEMISHVCEMF